MGTTTFPIRRGRENILGLRDVAVGNSWVCVCRHALRWRLVSVEYAVCPILRPVENMMERIILHPSQLAAAKKAGFVKETATGQMIIQTPYVGPFLVVVSQRIPVSMSD